MTNSAPDYGYDGTGLDPAFSFDNFVVGESNQSALNAANRASRKPREIFSPLLICGDARLGKTHILHAIGNAILAKKTPAKVRYTTAHRYFVYVLQANSAENHSEYVHNCHAIDLLLVDDMQGLLYEDGWHKVALQNFSEILRKQKTPAVLAVSAASERLGEIVKHLAGILDLSDVVVIGPQEPEVKIEILMRNAQQMEIELTEDAASFLAQNNPEDSWRLPSLLKLIAIYSKNSGSLPQTLNVDTCRAALDKFYDADDPVYNQAVKCVLENRRVSISLIQRHLLTGYHRTFRFIERMEEQGIVVKRKLDGRRDAFDLS